MGKERDSIAHRGVRFLDSHPVMDIRYLPTRPMSQHMHVLGLLGLKGDLLVSSLTFSIFPTDTRIQ